MLVFSISLVVGAFVAFWDAIFQGVIGFLANLA